jgi:hypothetical protein
MNAQRKYRTSSALLLILLTLVALITSDVFGQLQRFTLQNREYRLEGNKWYTFFEGKKGDEIIPQRLIVRLKDRGYVENFEFQ